jgi:PST family polysaccharide transporter
MVYGWISSTIAVVAMLAGLPWGTVALAACYALSSALVCMPILFCMAGRKGHVRTPDLFRIMALPGLAAVGTGLASVAYRRWLMTGHALADCALSFVVAALAAGAVVVATPAGRRVLSDTFHWSSHLRRRG